MLKAEVGWFVATIILVALACFHFPQSRLSTGLDPSWVGALQYAHDNGFQFGKDIVFTYGPLGLFSVSCFIPSVAVERIFFEIIVGFSIATGLCLLAWRLRPPWRIAALAYFVCIGAAKHLGGAVSFLDLGFFVWGWLCFFESGKRLWLCVPMLLFLAAVGSLVKFTYLAMGLLTITWLVADLVLRKRYVAALALLPAFAVLFLAGWFALGQSFDGIAPFLRNSAEVASGYNDTMGARSSTNETLFVFMWCLFCLALAIRLTHGSKQKIQERNWRLILLAVWIAGLMFEEWKYGAVRSDLGHITAVLTFVPIAAVFSELLPATRIWVVRASRLAMLIGLVFIIILLQRHDRQFFLITSLKQTAHNLAGNARVLAQPAAYLREKNEELSAAKVKTQMPQVCALVGHAPVDVFGDNQGYALLNDLNYHPRPCIQSYTAYTRRLMELDDAFYRSTSAPEYILFNLEGIDGRFSPLEDAWALRDVLVNYTLVTTNEYPVLRKKSTTQGSLSLLKEGTVNAGEKIELGSYTNSKLWLEIELHPTFFGRLRSFFYKPSQTQLDIWSDAAPDVKMSFVAPVRMLSAGFVASPLLFNNDDAIRVYQGGKGQQPKAMAVYVPKRMLKSWQPEIRYRIYRIQE